MSIFIICITQKWLSKYPVAFLLFIVMCLHYFVAVG